MKPYFPLGRIIDAIAAWYIKRGERKIDIKPEQKSYEKYWEGKGEVTPPPKSY